MNPVVYDCLRQGGRHTTAAKFLLQQKWNKVGSRKRLQLMKVGVLWYQIFTTTASKPQKMPYNLSDHNREWSWNLGVNNSMGLRVIVYSLCSWMKSKSYQSFDKCTFFLICFSDRSIVLIFFKEGSV